MTKISNLYTLTNYINADSNGDIGIGIVPQWNLSTFLALEISNTGLIYAGNGQMAIGNNAYYSTSWKYKSNNSATLITTDAGTFQFSNAASGTTGNTISWVDRFRITSSGQVGIGTTSPGYKLDVYGTNQYLGRFDTSDTTGGFVTFAKSNTSFGYIGSAHHIIVSGSSNDMAVSAVSHLVFGAGSLTERMRIQSSGEVQINTTTVYGSKLTVNGSIYQIDGTKGIYSNTFGALNGGGTVLKFEYSGAGTVAFNNGTNRLVIQADGAVYLNKASYIGGGYGLVIGSDDPLLQCLGLFVKNNGNNSVNFFNASGTYVSSISINASTVTYGTGSDYRLKEDYRDFDGLEKVSAIKVYDFKFKAEGDRMEGVIAHELQEVIPYAVNGEKDAMNDNGTPKIQNVDYSKLVPILTKAIQELSAKVTALENK